MRNIIMSPKDLSEFFGLLDVCSLDPTYNHDFTHDDRPDWILDKTSNSNGTSIGLEVTNSRSEDEMAFSENIVVNSVDEILSKKYKMHGSYILGYHKNGDWRIVKLNVPEYDVYFGSNKKCFYELKDDVQKRIRSATIIDPFYTEVDVSTDSFDKSFERFKIKCNDLQEYKHECDEYHLYIHGCKNSSYSGKYLWVLYESMKNYQSDKERVFSTVFCSFPGMLVKFDFKNEKITIFYRKQMFDANSVVNAIDGKKLNNAKFSDILKNVPCRLNQEMEVSKEVIYEPFIPDKTGDFHQNTSKPKEDETIPGITTMMEDCVKRRKLQDEDWL